MYQALLTPARDHLRDVILPFWTRLRDDAHGGYIGFVDAALVPNPAYEKGCILNSRILWFFASAARTLRDDSLIPYARHAYVMLRDRFLDKENGGLYWSVTHDGKPLDTSKHTYNQAFGVYGLSAYYALTGDAEARDLAQSLVDVIEAKCADTPGTYLEAFDAAFAPLSDSRLSSRGLRAVKTTNTLLHVMEAYTAYAAATSDPAIRAPLTAIMRTIETKNFNPEKARMEVFFDRDMRSLADMQSYGHDIETAWLIDRALDTLADPALDKALRHIPIALADACLARAFDGRCLINEVVDGTDDATRVWWVEAEAVVGFLNAHERTGNPAHLEAARAIWDYTMQYVVDHRPGGEWYAALDGDDNVVPLAIVQPWKCPYHNGRMCLEIIERAAGEDR